LLIRCKIPPAGDTLDRIGPVTRKVLLEPEDETPPADDVGHAFDEAPALEAAKRKAAERGHHALKVVREDGFPRTARQPPRACCSNG